MAQALEADGDGGFRDIVGRFAQQGGGPMNAIPLKVLHPGKAEGFLKQLRRCGRTRDERLHGTGRLQLVRPGEGFAMPGHTVTVSNSLQLEVGVKQLRGLAVVRK